MRSARMLGLLLASLILIPIGSAADPGASAVQGTSVYAELRRGNSRGILVLSDAAGTGFYGIPPDTDSGGGGTTGCAFLTKLVRVSYSYGYGYNYRQDYGCGRLTYTTDPLMDVMRVRGSLRSYFNRGKITVDVTLRALTPLLPYTSVRTPGGVSFYPRQNSPGDSVGIDNFFDMTGGLRREAQVNGTMKSALVALTKRQGAGTLYRGASIWLNT